MVQIMSGLENDKDEWKDYQHKVTISSNICNKLKNNTSKKNIMQQCKELFFDKQFFELVDRNVDLLCCSNGVINLATGEFRKGYPEDYITNYVSLGIDENKENIMTISILKEKITEIIINTL